MPAPTQASHCPPHPGALPGWGKHIQLGGEADHPDETQPGQTPGSGSRGVRQDPVSGGVSCHGALHSREMSRALSRVGTGLARQRGSMWGVQLLSSSLPGHKPQLCPRPACLVLVSPSLHQQLALPLAHLHPCPSPPPSPRLRRQHRHRRPTPASRWWWAGAHSACPACLAGDAVIGTCQTAAAHFRKSRGLLQSRC